MLKMETMAIINSVILLLFSGSFIFVIWAVLKFVKAHESIAISLREISETIKEKN